MKLWFRKRSMYLTEKRTAPLGFCLRLQFIIFIHLQSFVVSIFLFQFDTSSLNSCSNSKLNSRILPECKIEHLVSGFWFVRIRSFIFEFLEIFEVSLTPSYSNQNPEPMIVSQNRLEDSWKLNFKLQFWKRKLYLNDKKMIRVALPHYASSTEIHNFKTLIR